MSLFLGILLAALCALATNIGFLYKHRGACAAPPGKASCCARFVRAGIGDRS
jgi:hypothetical protein